MRPLPRFDIGPHGSRHCSRQHNSERDLDGHAGSNRPPGSLAPRPSRRADLGATGGIRPDSGSCRADDDRSLRPPRRRIRSSNSRPCCESRTNVNEPNVSARCSNERPPRKLLAPPASTPLRSSTPIASSSGQSKARWEARRTRQGVEAADVAWRQAKARLIELETGAPPSWAATVADDRDVATATTTTTTSTEPGSQATPARNPAHRPVRVTGGVG